MKIINDLIDNYKLSSCITKIRDKINKIYNKHNNYILFNFKVIHERYNLTDVLCFMHSNHMMQSQPENFTKLDFPMIKNLDIDYSYAPQGSEIYCDFNGIHVGIIANNIDNVNLTIILSTDGYFVSKNTHKIKTNKINFTTSNNKIGVKNVLKDLESLSIALDKTMIFYDNLKYLFREQDPKRFVREYSKYSDLLQYVFICSPKEIKEKMYNEMKSYGVKVTKDSINDFIKRMEKERPGLIYNKESDLSKTLNTIDVLKKDINAGMNSFSLMNSMLLTNEMKESLLNNNISNNIKKEKTFKI